MGHMEVHANLDELHLLGHAEVQRLEEGMKASEVQEEEDSKKLWYVWESETASEDDWPEEDVSTPSENIWE